MKETTLAEAEEDGDAKCHGQFKWRPRLNWQASRFRQTKQTQTQKTKKTKEDHDTVPESWNPDKLSTFKMKTAARQAREV